MIVKVDNLLTIDAPKTFLAVKLPAGTTSLGVKNTGGFSSSWAIQLGETNQEMSEIKVLGTAGPSGTTLTITAATSFDHPSDTPVYAIKYDQVVFKKSTSGTAGTASAIASGTINITPDQPTTFFDDTTSSATDAYKACFRNSITGDVSADSDWLSATGASFYSLAKMRERIKRKLFSYGFIKQDEEIDDWINEWVERMNNAAVKVNQSFLMGTMSVSFDGTNGYGTITAADYKASKQVWVSYNGVEKHRASSMDVSQIFPSESVNSTQPFLSWRDDLIFQILPINGGGTAEFIYYKRTPTMYNDSDELPNSMRSYTTSFVNYAVSEAYNKDLKTLQAQMYLARAESALNDFTSEITPRDQLGVQMIHLDFSVYGDDSEIL
jgi:hypothetical protein